jgi:hypothetical protein
VVPAVIFADVQVAEPVTGGQHRGEKPLSSMFMW